MSSQQLKGSSVAVMAGLWSKKQEMVMLALEVHFRMRALSQRIPLPHFLIVHFRTIPVPLFRTIPAPLFLIVIALSRLLAETVALVLLVALMRLATSIPLDLVIHSQHRAQAQVKTHLDLQVAVMHLPIFRFQKVNERERNFLFSGKGESECQYHEQQQVVKKESECPIYTILWNLELVCFHFHLSTCIAIASSNYFFFKAFRFSEYLYF
jgi:hypothetical protein